LAKMNRLPGPPYPSPIPRRRFAFFATIIRMKAKIPLTLYPTAQLLAQAIDRMVDEEGGKARLLPGMMTIQAFERKLYAQLVGQPKPAGWFIRSILLSKAIDSIYGKKRSTDTPGPTGALTGAIRFPGFLDAMLELFSQLGAGLVSPDDLARITEYAPSKESEILRLYMAYKEELDHHGVEDPAMTRSRMVDALLQGAQTPLLDNLESVNLEGIYQFTPYRFELFKNIARRTPVRIVAPAPDSRRGAFGFLSDNLAKFEELGDNAGKLEIAFTTDPAGPLADVRNSIFEMDPASHPAASKSQPVEIFACASRYREIEEVGHTLLRLVEEKDYLWRDFIIVMRDLRPYAAIVEDVFRRYSIPFSMVKGVPLTRAPLTRAALAPFVAIDSAYAREDVLRVVNSSYFQRFRELESGGARRLFINAGLINGPPAEWKTRLLAAVDRMEAPARKPAKKIATVTVDLLARLERLKSAGGPTEFTSVYISLLQWLGLTVPAKRDEVERPGSPMDQAMLFRDFHSHSMFLEVVQDAAMEADMIGKAGGGVGYGRMRDILIKTLDSCSLPEPGSADMNRAQILNVFDAVGVGAKVVFICGLHEGEFPQRGRTGAILTDMEKETFNKRHFETVIEGKRELRKGRRVFDSPSDKWMEESLLFFQAVRAAGERLYLSYSLQELGGASLMRSLFIDDMLDTLHPSVDLMEREKAIRMAPSLAIARPAAQLADPQEGRMKLLRDLFDQKALQEDLHDRVAAIAPDAKGWAAFRRLVSLSSMERGRDAYFAAIDPEQKARLGGAYSGEMTQAAELVQKKVVINREGRYSPTALETYGQCPFRYFAGRILALEPERAPDLQLEASDAGSMVHQILEDFYRKIIMQKRLPVMNTPAERKALHLEADRTFTALRKDGMLPEEAVWAPERERIMAMLDRWLQAEAWDQEKSGFVPTAVELAFDFNWHEPTAHEPYMLIAECGGLRYFTGRIDRLDVDIKNSAIRIVDYKLGANDTRYKEMLKRENMGKRSFQAPIYALLGEKWVVESGLMEKVENIAASYRLLGATEPNKAYLTAGHGGGRNRLEFVDHQFLGAGPGAESTQGTFENLATRMMTRLEDGMFQVDPLDCEYCKFPGLCRYIAAPRGMGEED